jgi:YfiH family protein
MTDPAFLYPGWPAPANVRALSTTRSGGISTGSFASLNFGLHVGDDPAAVAANRSWLRRSAHLPGEPVWLEQQHGIRVLDLDKHGSGETSLEADAAIASDAGRVCAILTADCLPVLLTDRAGTRVAAAHAGWRGLAAGIIEQTVAAMAMPGSDLLAWLGPCIGAAYFEIGPEVRDALLTKDPGASDCFRPGRDDRWHADLQALARRRLLALGVSSVSAAAACTYSDSRRFFSHRRDAPCGRMATLVWLEAGPSRA